MAATARAALAYAGYVLHAAGWLVRDVWWDEPAQPEVAWIEERLERAIDGLEGPVLVVAKSLGTFAAGLNGGFTRRQSLNAGVALVAHGEFTIILAQIASGNPSIDADARTDLVAFAGLYVLVTATIGIVLMKESKRLGRVLFPIRRLAPETR